MQDSLGSPGKERSCPRILLADDNAEILGYVGGLLAPDYDVIGKVVDGNAVCAEVKRLKPDLVVQDISMGDCSGIQIARRLREQGYGGEIVFLTVHDDPDFVTAAIGSGGRGYVIKSRIGQDLSLALKAVLEHRIFISAPLKQF